MNLVFDTILRKIYFESLNIIKDEQPRVWGLFCDNVPTFTVAFFNRCTLIGGLLTYVRYYKILRESKYRYKIVWNEYKSDIISKLEKIFGCQLEGSIIANICISPLYLRNIKKKQFIIPTNVDENRLLEILIHEISHFYFYEKIKGCDLSEEDAWLISEHIVSYIIKMFFDEVVITSSSYFTNPSNEQNVSIMEWLDGNVTFEGFVEKWREGKVE